MCWTSDYNGDTFERCYVTTLIQLGQTGQHSEIIELFGDVSAIELVHNFFLRDITEAELRAQIRNLLEQLELGDRIKKNGIDIDSGITKFIDLYSSIASGHVPPSLQYISNDIANQIDSATTELKSECTDINANIRKLQDTLDAHGKSDYKVNKKIDHLNSHEPSIPKRLTNRLPQTSLDKIIGRGEDLKNLHQKLFTHKKVVLLNGMGGIGKTTLAQVYVNEYKKKYRHIAWISNLSEDIKNDFINTEGLCLNLNIYREGKKTDELFSEIIAALNGITPSPNLLVIDNADATLSRYYDYLPSQPKWHILVTSREKIEKFDLQEIGFLSPEEAVNLFLKHYTLNKIQLDRIRYLVESVKFHTLTIEILAKSAQLQRFDIETLEHALDKDLKANVHIDHKGDKIERVTSYLCFIFDMSALSSNEIWLLKQFTCLPQEFHTHDFLKGLLAPESSENEDLFSETITNLGEKGWLLSNRENDSYKMHRIIADVISIKHPILLEDILGLIETITNILRIDQVKDNPIDKFPWVPFGKSIVEIISDTSDANIALLMNNLAIVLKDLGDYTGAKDLLEKALASDVKNFGPDHRTTAVRYSNLAAVLKDLGDYTGAKELLEKVLAFDVKNFGLDHPTTAISYSNLAVVLEALGDYTGAKELLEKALTSDVKNFGPDHPTTAIVYTNLALVLKALGDYTGAKDLLEKALLSDVKNFGPDHPTTAALYSSLALVLRDLGDNTGAKELLEKALTSDVKNFGLDHPKTAIVYTNLALVLKALGDNTGAKDLFEKALASDVKNFGPDHPTTAISYSNLAAVLKDFGDNTGAKELLEKALASDVKTFGPDHPKTAVCYSNLAILLKDLGDYRGAKELLEKALASVEKNFRPDHPTNANSFSYLAAVLNYFGDDTGTKDLLEKALASDVKTFGPDHIVTAIRYFNLALMLKDLGDNKGAKELLEKALVSVEKNFGPYHPTTTAHYSVLAMVLTNLDDYAGAKDFLEKALASVERNFGPEHPIVSGFYSNLAAVLKDLGDFAGAKSFLEKALASDEKNFGPDHPKTAVSYSNLALVLQGLGMYEKALEFSKEAMRIFTSALPEGHPNIKMVTDIYNSIKECVEKTEAS